MDSNRWIVSFEKAIQSRDTDLLHKLLQTLPSFQNSDVMKQVLFLTMDAENMLCKIRQQLVSQREIITSQHA